MIKAQLADYTLFMDYATGRISGAYLAWYCLKLRLRTGIRRIVYFGTDVELGSTSVIYKRYAKMTPYKWNRDFKKYNHAKDNEIYYRKLDKFHKILSKLGMLGIHNFFPWNYVGSIYGARSLQRINITDEAARPHQERYIKRVLAILFAHHDDPWIEFSNEASHGGNWDYGRKIAKQHLFWFEVSKMPMNRVIWDNHSSDYVTFEVIERHQDIEGVWGGDDKYHRDKKHHFVDVHSIGLAKHLDRAAEEGGHTPRGVFTGTGWRFAIPIFNSDANIEGDGDPYVLGTYVNANHRQLYNKYHAIWSQNLAWMGEELPMEMWVRCPDDPKNAYADRKKLKFGRLRQIRKARKAVIKGVS